MASLVDKFQWGQTLTVDTDPDSTHTVTAHVYALIHPDDGVIYAGSTRTPVEDRLCSPSRHLPNVFHPLLYIVPN